MVSDVLPITHRYRNIAPIEHVSDSLIHITPLAQSPQAYLSQLPSISSLQLRTLPRPPIQKQLASSITLQTSTSVHQRIKDSNSLPLSRAQDHPLPQSLPPLHNHDLLGVQNMSGDRHEPGQPNNQRSDNASNTPTSQSEADLRAENLQLVFLLGQLASGEYPIGEFQSNWKEAQRRNHHPQPWDRLPKSLHRKRIQSSSNPAHRSRSSNAPKSPLYSPDLLPANTTRQPWDAKSGEGRADQLANASNHGTEKSAAKRLRSVVDPTPAGKVHTSRKRKQTS